MKFSKIAFPIFATTFLMASTVATCNAKDRESGEPDFKIETSGYPIIGFSYTPANDPSMRCSGVANSAVTGGVAVFCWKAEPNAPAPKPAAPSGALTP